MSLRSRLFIWISALLLIAGGVSYFLEIVIVKKELKVTRAQLRHKIEELNEKKREQIVRFVAAGIREMESRIDMLLERLSTYPLQAAAFAPTESNLEMGTWLPASEILLNYPWIDFIQNTCDGKVLSLIMPTVQNLHPSGRTLINDEMAWIELAKEPYLGIQMHFQSILPQDTHEKIETRYLVPSIYALFDPLSLRDPDAKSQALPLFHGQVPALPVIASWMDGAELDMDRFSKTFVNACQYLSTHAIPALPPVDERAFKPDWIRRYDQRYLIWGLAAMHQAKLFGKNLFASPSPQGVALYLDDEHIGVGVHITGLFFQEPFDIPFADRCIDFQVENRVYFGRTIPYRVKPVGQPIKTSYLTIGVDTEAMVEKLQLALNQSVWLVHGGKIITELPPDGSPPAIQEILDQKEGTLKWRGKDFYFMQITPLPDLDLHFFLLNPVEVEFALLNSLNQGARVIVHELLKNIHLVGLSVLIFAILILHYLARRITKPISRLAMASSQVGAGHLSDLDIPMPPENDTDEVATLCRAFHQMVTGIQEKEKVKAVLNKVVSQEIAQEILKGNVHLGGEEKKVTVLFADIRQFTQMTQHMAPQDVIALLNDCMTQISHVIDLFGGVIDKYVGDEVMALFGAPVERKESAHQAVSCALEIIAVLTRWNEGRRQNGLLPVNVGIGIHTGTMLVGNMGAENRLNYTVLGSNVNLAARLCSAALPMEILISESTLQEPQVKDAIASEPLPAMYLKGFDIPVVIYRVKPIL